MQNLLLFHLKLSAAVLKMSSKKNRKSCKYSSVFHRQISRNVLECLNYGTQSTHPSVGNVIQTNVTVFQDGVNNVVSENKYSFGQELKYMY